jgi:GNAT superfamily N-acetyltransferase
VEVRKARPGDGEGLARIWAENAAYYAELFPEDFRRPDEESFAEKLDSSLARQADDNQLWLVAEIDGVIAGQLLARVEPPLENAHEQMVSHLAETRLLIDALGTATAYQRRGVATALVEAVEEWGRSRGATKAILDTYIRSELSMPFWEKRMRYTPHSVIFHKRLPRQTNGG